MVIFLVMDVERETIITFNDASDELTIYSCTRRVWTDCEKKGLKFIKSEKIDGEDVARWYQGTIENLTIRSLREKRVLTDEQRRIMGERLSKSLGRSKEESPTLQIGLGQGSIVQSEQNSPLNSLDF